MAAKRLKLGVVIGVLVLTADGVVVCDTDTSTPLVEGDFVKLNPIERRARYADNLDDSADRKQYETARLLSLKLPEARKTLVRKPAV